MKLKLTANTTFGQFSSINKDQAKTEGLKIRQKKLQTKYKQLIQKHHTLQKFIPSEINQIDIEQSSNQGPSLPDQKSATEVHQTDKEFHEAKKAREALSDKKNQENKSRVNKRYQFLTARDFLEQSSSRGKTLQRPSLLKSNSFKSKLINPNQPNFKKSLHNQQQPSQVHFSTHEHLQTRQFIHKLDTQPSCYSKLQEKFLKSAKQIQINQEMLCLSHVCQNDRRLKLVNDFMKEMDFLLEQQDRLMLDVVININDLKENQLKQMYLQTHLLNVQLNHAKTAIFQHNQKYQNYLNALKQQETQRKLMLQSKRQFSIIKPQSTDNSPLRYLHKDLKIDQKDLKKLMEKKSKLNLELDLSFQIQQRRRISKEKDLFQAKKNKLQKDKLQIENKMKQVKQKIQFREKETERYEFQKERYMKEIENFLRMLLKNPEYRLDGAVWIFRKMIEYGFEPQLSDFPDSLDFSARSFLMDQFELMKQQKIYTIKPIETKKIRLMKKKKIKEPLNRQRVKSVTVFNTLRINQSPINNDLNSNLTSNFNDNSFFTFGSKNLILNQAQNLKIRKRSGSATLIKTYDQFLGQNESIQAKIKNKQNSFVQLTKQENRNKLYFSAKKYIKNWISEKGWNMCTARAVTKTQDNKGGEKFISQQKTRAKKKFFKIGRSNTRYKQIVKTLYGSQEDLKAANKRTKTNQE